MTDFKRPIPNRQNELLRKNLSAPQYDQESLSEKSEKGSSLARESSTLEINENFSDEDITKIKLLINSIDYRKEICEKGFHNIKKYNYEETYLMYKDFLIKQYGFINNSNI